MMLKLTHGNAGPLHEVPGAVVGVQAHGVAAFDVRASDGEGGRGHDAGSFTGFFRGLPPLAPLAREAAFFASVIVDPASFAALLARSFQPRR